ncbi:DUF4148 domain-containing protein [Achromobacter sp. GG226]|uniref:DUF4148 domain-containing protein n=1 Tax=Verticiella alkaliphila TaxID=2779529 RepID=UPI001C0B4592|nr:DUF4148 domain-containing protein [Verticiella sp. GG226]MBU4610334.1 DUF4148 domain-containing protein [Verticiella sp. GG226]
MKSLLSMAALVSLTVLSGQALADTFWHETQTEVGVQTQPSHATAGKSRDQVLGELAQAKARPDWGLQYYNLGTPGWMMRTSERSREDVVAERLAQTPAERERISAVYTPG